MKQGADARRADQFSSNKTGLSLIIVVHTRNFVPSRKRPEKPGHFQFQPIKTSGSDLGRLDLQELAGTCDRDRPRLIASGISRTRSTCRSLSMANS